MFRKQRIDSISQSVFSNKNSLTKIHSHLWYAFTKFAFKINISFLQLKRRKHFDWLNWLFESWKTLKLHVIDGNTSHDALFIGCFKWCVQNIHKKTVLSRKIDQWPVFESFFFILVVDQNFCPLVLFELLLGKNLDGCS